MNTGEDTRSLRKILNMSQAISVVLLLLHFYFYCYKAFEVWRLTSLLSDRILENIAKTGLFKTPNTSKWMVLAILAISLLGAGGRKEEKFSYRGGLIFILSGLLLYFGAYAILTWDTDILTIAYTYTSTMSTGYLLIITGGTRLSRVIRYTLRKNFFNKNNNGFQQEERLIETEFSLNLKAQYRWKGKTRESYINLINPRRAILIMGSPGSGKSWFIIEPFITQLIEKGFALFVYDFKYPALTHLVYNQFLRHRDKYPPCTSFYNINFTDLSHSHRCNLIEPATMEYLTDAIGASRTILLSMNKTWVNKQGEFFVESPVNFLAALIWYLRKFDGGRYCTLPHAIELAQAPYEKLFTLLNTEQDIQTLVNPFIEALRNKTMEMLDSQVSSAKIPLGRLASPDLYYILTGNDLSLDINDPAAPKILCLGGAPPRQEGLAPVLSLYIDRLNKLINKQGKHPCALVCDEVATVRAYSILNTIATARSNNIIPILAVQDLSQLRTQYSREEADVILNITGNLICGQVGGETARWVSERFPGTMQYKTTVSVNSSDTSVSKSEQTVAAISPSTIATLSSGEFVGIIADDPGMEMEFKAFHAKMVKDPASIDKDHRQELPVVRPVDAAVVEANFRKVKKEVFELVDSEMKRILGDPVLKGLVVKMR
jgi:hypothetical protein